ncbi:hypothetical protein ACT7C1_30800 [Bacillus paranthracis]
MKQTYRIFRVTCQFKHNDKEGATTRLIPVPLKQIVGATETAIFATLRSGAMIACSQQGLTYIDSTVEEVTP